MLMVLVGAIGGRMLWMNGLTREEEEIVEFPYADDWYNDPKMLLTGSWESE